MFWHREARFPFQNPDGGRGFEMADFLNRLMCSVPKRRDGKLGGSEISSMESPQLRKIRCFAGKGELMDAANTAKLKKQKPLQRLYSPKQVAEICAVDVRTVYRWIESGRLRAYKLGAIWRISEDDLSDFLEKSYV
jgi:excisionase family DNA binding protein